MTPDRSKRKYVLLVGDGMADYPLKELGGKTVLEAARTPFMDRIASCRIGLARTIPDGMDPGSDVANLSLLGYDPKLYHTMRAPFEAASMGVRLEPQQVAFRMNLVTLDRRSPGEAIMISHSSGDLSTEEASRIIPDLKRELERPGLQIFPGVGYRHLLVWDNGPEHAVTIPPHDMLDRDMAPYLNTANDPVPPVIRRSWDVLANHPVNLTRRASGQKEANSIWLWGQGKAPKMPRFKERFGIEGGVISAVDLVKGIGIYAGFTPIFVEGATGYLDTNYRGKAEEALKALNTVDFVFVHVEAPDEAGHNGNYKEKIEAIERFDSKVVGTILEGLEPFDDFRIMVVSDHFTPICRRTHTPEPPPFAWAGKAELETGKKGASFTEKAAMDSGIVFEKGHELIEEFVAG
ncbi:MAG: cofactor-independent phosphoglycerate mutase [Deltaproteobacteria bacterium HGW-Deltaproteobacteria-15]|jgi:2,3-bisphosphoglycerate-independent phosphoglycerate mutase|nr:MAG: cofactor-independent phosphoglycerate mutase [Deltaproteobacteria bacterium HGW-Deltaproteobacteria-15]